MPHPDFGCLNLLAHVPARVCGLKGQRGMWLKSSKTEVGSDGSGLNQIGLAMPILAK